MSKYSTVKTEMMALLKTVKGLHHGSQELVLSLNRSFALLSQVSTHTYSTSNSFKEKNKVFLKNQSQFRDQFEKLCKIGKTCRKIYAEIQGKVEVYQDDYLKLSKSLGKLCESTCIMGEDYKELVSLKQDFLKCQIWGNNKIMPI